jgi:prepilin peptidase CpaA
MIGPFAASLRGARVQECHVLEFAVLTVLPGAVAFAAAMDLFTMKIPNRISVVLVLAFFPLALLVGFSGWDLLNHLGAGLLMLAVGILLFIPGWFGGGDAKLMAAISLWLGLDCLPLYLLYVAIAGGVMAAAFLTARTVPLPRLLLGQDWALRLHRPGGGIPYGLALAAGALAVFPYSPWFASLI